jgi:DNA-directed RNA polymerase subunit RPC12/RpoP
VLWIEFTKFKCPQCRSSVDVAAQGQGFIERMEKPGPVSCPACETQLILSPRTFLFRLGILLFSIGGPLLYFWLDQNTVPLIACSVGGLLLVISLLSNKLITRQA